MTSDKLLAMSDTPETDAHQAQESMAHDWLWRNFARKLERERDAAIAELEAWRSEKGPEGWWVKYEDHMAQLNEMTLRWERANDSLFEERVLADRLAEALNATRWDSPIACKSAFDTWKDERGLNWSKQTKNNEY